MMLQALLELIVAIAVLLAPSGTHSVDSSPSPQPSTVRQDVIQLAPLPLADPVVQSERGSFDGILWDDPRALERVSHIA